LIVLSPVLTVVHFVSCAHLCSLCLLCYVLQGIVLTAYSPLGSGSADPNGHTIITNPTLAEIGKKYGKSAPQTALAFTLQRGIIIIPKSVSAARIAMNLDVDFKLSEEDMTTIKALDLNTRGPAGWGGPRVQRNGREEPRDLVHPLYPFRLEPDFF
jgi:alcohol dehydrogenase (NADP+)